MKMSSTKHYKMESSMEAAMRDNLLSCILSRLLERKDRLSASMVCKSWNDVLTRAVHELTIRSRTHLPSLILRFKHVKHLNFYRCLDQLQDSDLQMISQYIETLGTLSLGNPSEPQKCISNLGFISFVQNCSMLEQVTLSGIPNLQDSGIETMTRFCKGLRSVILKHCDNLSDGTLESLKYCKNIQELSLQGSFRFTPSGWSKLGEYCPNLQKFSVDVDEPIDITLALKSLATHCSHLQELSLYFDRGDLRMLSGLSTLIVLHICTEQDLADDSLVSIVASNRGLKEFRYFNWACFLSDAALIAIIQNCKNLEKLELGASTLTESALLSIKECKALKSLVLEGFVNEWQGLHAVGSCIRLKDFSLLSCYVRDVDLETLMHSNKQLERIALENVTGPSSKGYSAIGLCSNLQDLDLSCTDVDDLGLVAIANGAKMLRKLCLKVCDAVTDMEILSNFRALENLNVNGCQFVTDEGLRFLAARCSKLSHLNLASTKITDHGLSFLASCSMLQELRIPLCRGVQGHGLVTIASSCRRFQYLEICHQFKGTAVIEELTKRFCKVEFRK